MIVPKTGDCIYNQINLFHDNRLHMEEEEKKKKSESKREIFYFFLTQLRQGEMTRICAEL